MSNTSHRLKIAILEDNEDRTIAMRAVLTNKFSKYESHFFPRAHSMILWLQQYLDEVIAISLDHDLELSPLDTDRTDPGDGRMVANALAERAPSCPVIIHTTNGPAGDSMEAALSEAGWSTQRITPYDDLLWVREAWLPLMREALA